MTSSSYSTTFPTWLRSSSQRCVDGDALARPPAPERGRRSPLAGCSPPRSEASEAPFVERAIPHTDRRDRPPSQARRKRSKLAPSLAQLHRRDVHRERHAPAGRQLPHITPAQTRPVEGARDLVTVSHHERHASAARASLRARGPRESGRPQEPVVFLGRLKLPLRARSDTGHIPVHPRSFRGERRGNETRAAPPADPRWRALTPARPRSKPLPAQAEPRY